MFGSLGSSLSIWFTCKLDDWYLYEVLYSLHVLPEYVLAFGLVQFYFTGLLLQQEAIVDLQSLLDEL